MPRMGYKGLLWDAPRAVLHRMETREISCGIALGAALGPKGMLRAGGTGVHSYLLWGSTTGTQGVLWGCWGDCWGSVGQSSTPAGIWGSPELQPGHSAQPPILLPQSHHPNVPVAPHCSSGQHWARATHEETIRAGISPRRAVPLGVVAAGDTRQHPNVPSAPQAVAEGWRNPAAPSWKDGFLS